MTYRGDVISMEVEMTSNGVHKNNLDIANFKARGISRSTEESFRDEIVANWGEGLSDSQRRCLQRVVRTILLPEPDAQLLEAIAHKETTAT